ncbi:MAG: tyrosine-type recombinase/integrase [Thermus sp.]|uniref:tyrosine-type recombinase/integrase n=1 Tax=Thermus sp. TaxID=275 RepID=UPI003D0C5D62
MPKRGAKPRRRPDGTWEARVYVEEGGRRVRKSFYGRTAREAQAKATEFLAKHRMGLIPKRDPRTFGEFARAWLERKGLTRAPTSLRVYEREVGYLLPHLGPKQMQKITPQDVRSALDALARRGLSPRTLRKVLERARAIFKEAVALELVARDPTAAVKVEVPSRPPVGRALEPHEAEALLAAFDAWPTWEVGMALRLCLALGLRAGEALGLQWGDLDLEAATLTVRRAWTVMGGRGVLTEPKTSRARRTLPVPHGTLERLRARYRVLLELGYTPEELRGAWVFPGMGDDSRPLNPHTLGHALRKITKRLGLPPVRVHDLRHSYGSLLLANGAPLELVAERMGHANPNITLGIYRHLLGHERAAWVVDPEDLIRRPRAQA